MITRSSAGDRRSCCADDDLMAATGLLIVGVTDGDVHSADKRYEPAIAKPRADNWVLTSSHYLRCHHMGRDETFLPLRGTAVRMKR